MLRKKVSIPVLQIDKKTKLPNPLGGHAQAHDSFLYHFYVAFVLLTLTVYSKTKCKARPDQKKKNKKLLTHYAMELYTGIRRCSVHCIIREECN